MIRMAMIKVLDAISHALYTDFYIITYKSAGYKGESYVRHFKSHSECHDAFYEDKKGYTYGSIRLLTTSRFNGSPIIQAQLSW